MEMSATPATQKPAMPTVFSARPANDSVALTWERSSPAAGYSVSYGLHPDGPIIDTVSSVVEGCTVTGLRPASAYFFDLLAYNTMGDSPSVRTTATTLTVPAAPTNLPSRPGIPYTHATTHHSVSLIWGGPTSPEYKVSYGLDDKERKIIATTSTQYLNHTLRGLLPKTKYFIEVRGSNASGESEPSLGRAETKVFEAPRNLRVGEVAEESATWQWSTGADYSSDTRYELYLDDRYLETISDTRYVIKGLIENTRYVFKVRAKLMDEAFSDSVQGSFTTLAYRADRICSPGNLSVVRSGATTAVLKWDEPYATCSLCPNAVGYEISGEDIETFEVLRPPCEVKGLNALRDYQLTVRAIGGVSNISTPSHVLLARHPGVPRTLVVAAISSASATLTWAAPAEAVPVFDYLVNCNGKFIAATRLRIYQISALEASSDYTVEVRSRTATSTLSDPVKITFSTMDDVGAPNAPGNFRFSQAGHLSVLHWDAPTSGANVIDYRVVLNSPLVGSRSYDCITVFLPLILLPRTRYSVAITARNAHGNSPSLESELTTD